MVDHMRGLAERSAMTLAALAAALCLAVVPAAAQSKGYDPPRLADGKPDFNGIWQAPGKNGVTDLEGKIRGKKIIVDPADGKIPYLPAALAKRAENNKNRATADPLGKCYMPGTPRLMYINQPFQFVETSTGIAILSQFAHVVRNIHMERADHLKDIDFWMGDSVGHWEGDTLVVDNADFNDKTWLDSVGNYHSDALHVVERFTRTGPDTLTYEATIEDPKVFSKPWKISVPLALHTEKFFQILEFECYASKEGPTVTEGTKPDPHRENASN